MPEVTLPEIPGELVRDRNILNDLKQIVVDLLQTNMNPQRFPGAQPISFSESHLEELKNENYFVSEKADGIRCLLYTRTFPDSTVESYLIDRKNNYYRLKFGLPLPGLKKSHQNTIVDGELVFETFFNKKTLKKETELMFLIFDALLMDNKLLVNREYTKRLGYLRTTLIVPYMEAYKRDPVKYARIFPFKISQKRLESSYHVPIVFDHMKKYGHGTDGVIFTSAIAQYTFGTCDKMYLLLTRLKWKPAHENTVDFKIFARTGQDGRFDFFLGILVHDNEYREFGRLTLDKDQMLE
jgi:mRNA guanylyltransferase